MAAYGHRKGQSSVTRKTCVAVAVAVAATYRWTGQLCALHLRKTKGGLLSLPSSDPLATSPLDATSHPGPQPHPSAAL